MTETLLTQAADRTGELDLDPRIGIEVLESVRATAAVRKSLHQLRGRGHVLALDDWTAMPDQQALLPLADVVKIDLRDLITAGPGLLDSARACGALTVAERVETPSQLHWCAELGFDFFQGNLYGAAQTLQIRVSIGAAA